MLIRKGANLARKLSQRARKQSRRGQVSLIWKSRSTRLIPELKEHIHVISFLQVIQIDFARLESETTAAESEVVRTSDEFTGKAELTRTANTQEVEYKTQILTDDGFNEKETTNRVDFAHPGTRKEVVHSPEKAKFIVTETIPEVFYEDHDRRSCGQDFREPDSPARDTMTRHSCLCCNSGEIKVMSCQTHNIRMLA